MSLTDARLEISVSETHPRRVVLTMRLPGVDPIPAPMDRAACDWIIAELTRARAVAWPDPLPMLPRRPSPHPARNGCHPFPD